LEGAGTTGGRRLVAQRPPTLDGRTAAGPRLSGRAAVAVVRRRIGDPLCPEESHVAMGRGSRLGDVGLKASLCTGIAVLTMILAHSRHHGELLPLQGLLGL
jgi:hypothetical protein